MNFLAELAMTTDSVAVSADRPMQSGFGVEDGQPGLMEFARRRALPISRRPEVVEPVTAAAAP